MIALAARAAAKVPVATEDGFDGLVNVESEFCGLTQELVPFPYDQTNAALGPSAGRGLGVLPHRAVRRARQGVFHPP